MKDKKIYRYPEIEVILYEVEDSITTSGDYKGVNFEDLI